MTMQVKLIRYTPEPEKTVAMSARLCYSPIGAAQLEEKMTDEQAAKLVRKLISMGHLSTVEHVTFTFAIEGVSRVLTHQLVRHRIASYSQQSQRYVKEHNFETIMPPTIHVMCCPMLLRPRLCVRLMYEVCTIFSACAAACGRNGKLESWPGKCWLNAKRLPRYYLKRQVLLAKAKVFVAKGR